MAYFCIISPATSYQCQNVQPMTRLYPFRPNQNYHDAPSVRLKKKKCGMIGKRFATKISLFPAPATLYGSCGAGFSYKSNLFFWNKVAQPAHKFPSNQCLAEKYFHRFALNPIDSQSYGVNFIPPILNIGKEHQLHQYSISERLYSGSCQKPPDCLEK